MAGEYPAETSIQSQPIVPESRAYLATACFAILEWTHFSLSLLGPGSSGNTTLRNEQGDSDAIDLERLLGLAVNKFVYCLMPFRPHLYWPSFCQARRGAHTKTGNRSRFWKFTRSGAGIGLVIPANSWRNVQPAKHHRWHQECQAPGDKRYSERIRRRCKAGRDASYVFFDFLWLFFTNVIFTVVLGRPGSGCSTLLKTLANQTSECHSVEGEVHYGPFTSGEIRQHYRGDVLYSPEGTSFAIFCINVSLSHYITDDIHFPTLTVGQTITFAARTRAPASDGGRCGLSRNDYADLLTTNLLSVFGLTHARNTLVGDAAIRGVSGGEKKRVSICEALAARARIVSWDKCVALTPTGHNNLTTFSSAPLEVSMRQRH